MPADYDNIYDYPFSVVREHPSSIDRSAGNAVTDGQTITVGETLGPKQAVYLHYPADVRIIAPDGSTLYEGQLGTSTTFTPSMPGTYRVVGDRGEISTFEVEPGAGNSEEDTVGNPGDWTNNAPDGPSAHDRAVSAPGVVASDNEEGAALAPSLRDDDLDGDAVQTPQGTIDVGAPEADETVPGSSSGGGSGSGVIGAVGAGILLVLAAAAALLGGGDGGE